MADAVLLEGYVLYPYRASAAKNRLRWQFGVLVPPAWGRAHEEHVFQQTEILMEPRGAATLALELRFLHAQRRTVQQASDGGGFTEVAELHLADRVLVPWDEGAEERVEVSVPVAELLGEGGVTFPFRRPARVDPEPVLDADGRTVGRLVRRTEEIEGVLRLRATELPGAYRVLRLRAVVENTSPWTPPPGTGPGDREAALPHSLVAAHLLLGLDSGSFLSMTDPPEWARQEVAACENRHTWPVLAGEPGRADVVLSSPIILEDHPAIAPESAGAMYDATEIDEILALRTAALTEQEKREARGTDPRAAAVIDLADSMPPEVLERLHGAVRALREVTGPEQPPLLTELTELRSEDVVFRPDTPGGTRPGRTPRTRPATGSRSTEPRWVPAAASCSAPDCAAPTPRTCSSRAVPRWSRPSCTTSTGECTSPSPSRTTRARTSGGNRAGSSTSSPTRSPPWRTRERAGPDRGHRQRLPRRRRLRRRDRAGAGRAPLPDGVEVVDFGVRGVHLAYQLLDGYDTLLLVDATARGGEPGTLYLIEADGGAGAQPADDGAPPPVLDGHHMSPDAVLALLDTLCAGTGATPPRRTLVLGCEPAGVEEGIGLSAPVAAAVPEAVRTALDLIHGRTHDETDRPGRELRRTP